MLSALAAGTVTSGVQGLAPMLPAMQGALGLSEAQIALFTSVYLVPSVLFAFPAGLLTERLGRREMYVISMALYGIGGIVQVVFPTWEVILATRALQGTSFGVVLALSITMIGDVLRGTAQVRGQGRRVVAMAAGETLFPAAAGVLAGLAWYAPFGMQALALVLAVVAWFALPRRQPADVPDRPEQDTADANIGPLRQVAKSLAAPGIFSVQLLTFMRFFIKFAHVTYFPLLAVNVRGMSVLAVGVAMGAASLLGTGSAAIAGRVLSRVRSSVLLAGALLVIGVSLVFVAFAPAGWAILIGLMTYCVADGLFSVVTNALATAVAPADARAAFVAFTGTVRNLGKLVAPLAFGALTLAMPVAVLFAVWGGIGLVSAALPHATRRFDGLLDS